MVHFSFKKQPKQLSLQVNHRTQYLLNGVNIVVVTMAPIHAWQEHETYPHNTLYAVMTDLCTATQ